MIYSAILVLHIAVALVTIGAILFSAYAVVRRKSNFYKHLALGIAGLAALETASGFALAVLSPTVTVAYVSSHLVWYLGLCLLAEAALMFRMRTVWIG